MARFFFQVRIGDEFFDDPEGSELAHLVAVRAQAVRIARGVMSGNILEGVLGLGASVEVRDHAWRLVLTLPFADAFLDDSVIQRPPASFVPPLARLRLVPGSSLH
jgi:hypothetical protein